MMSVNLDHTGLKVAPGDAKLTNGLKETQRAKAGPSFAHTHTQAGRNKKINSRQKI
jgi:hypothetical protein